MQLKHVVLSALITTLGIGGGVATTARAAEPSSAPVFDFSMSQQAGISTLVRSPNGVSGSLATSGTGILPHFAYTLWFVIFNEPENCMTDDGEGGTMCGEMDVNPFGPAVVDVISGGGNVTGEAGTLHVTGRVRAGDSSNSLFGALGFPSVGLIYPEAAEIHLVLRSHGPKVPAEMPAQIQSYAGGCYSFLNPPDIADEVGECSDIQFSVQQP